MSLFRGSIYIGVDNLEAAVAWYKEKLDLRESREPIDEEVGEIALVSRNQEIFVAMGTPNETGPDTQIFFTGNVQKSRDWLAARGVSLGPIQTDRQGTRYVEMRDLENNMIEICEEP
ncbi:MAG: hypothetical protein LAP21_14925 [Acidobacteriia bacterium]|nr:hypothetical protein [Terriglobia bacterium]